MAGAVKIHKCVWTQVFHRVMLSEEDQQFLAAGYPPHHPHLAVKEPIIVAHWFRDDDVSHFTRPNVIGHQRDSSHFHYDDLLVERHELVACYSMLFIFPPNCMEMHHLNRITCILDVQLDKSWQMDLLISVVHLPS